MIDKVPQIDLDIWGWEAAQERHPPGVGVRRRGPGGTRQSVAGASYSSFLARH